MTQQQPSDHIPEAKKMVPGDELHLTLLMAPFSLNFFTGQDRQHLLAFGRAAFEAGQAAAQQAVQADAPTIAELEASAELGALRDVYEMARGVLRFDGIDMVRALKYKDGLIEAIETVKTIDGGAWEPAHPAEGVPDWLRQMEWAVSDYDRAGELHSWCPNCGGCKADYSDGQAGHKDSCELAAALAATQPADGVPAQAFKTKVYQALGIGSACDEHVAFANIENLIRREHCLSAIEREFFMVETPPDEGEGDTGPGEECLLNWGSTPEQYVKQFAEAIAAAHPTQQGMDAGKLLAEKHTGMKVDYRGLLGQVRRAIKHTSGGHEEMLRQLEGHITELGQRWYAGDTAVVDELLQLYCVEREARAALAAQAKQSEAIAAARAGGCGCCSNACADRADGCRHIQENPSAADMKGGA